MKCKTETAWLREQPKTDSPEKSAEEMSFQELVDHMLYSELWKAKEKLFLEVFPTPEERLHFFTEYTRQLVAGYRQAGKPIGGLHDLRIRKLAVDQWFKLVPKSLLATLH